MLSKKSHPQRTILTRVVMMILMILLSKNVEIEIIKPQLTIRVNIESVYLKSYEKLLEWF